MHKVMGRLCLFTLGSVMADFWIRPSVTLIFPMIAMLIASALYMSGIGKNHR
jgi:hypothetical protein